MRVAGAILEVLVDGGLEFGDAGDGETLELALVKFREQALGGVEPAAAQGAEPPTPEDVRQALRSAGFLQSLRGPVLELVGTQDGGIWVALDGGSEHEMPWILLDRSGQTAAWVLLPRSEQIKAARAGRLVTVSQGDFDVETVRIYQVPNLPALDEVPHSDEAHRIPCHDA